MFRKTIVTIFIILGSVHSFAAYDSRDAYEMSFIAEQYQPSEITVKRSVIKSFLAYHWRIVEHDRYRMRAVYKDRCAVEVVIEGSVVRYSEEKKSSCSTFREAWIKSLGNAYLQYVETSYHVNNAIDMIAEGDS